jgi:hypothetical protein
MPRAGMWWRSCLAEKSDGAGRDRYLGIAGRALVARPCSANLVSSRDKPQMIPTI